jgi:hydrogenase expression/formation protein HypC
MCLAMPGRVVSVDRAAACARVDVLGVARTVNLSLVDPVAPGDWVLVQMGFAVARMSEAEAAESVRLFEALGAVLTDASVGAAEPTS